jgi:hypothetical protein
MAQGYINFYYRYLFSGNSGGLLAARLVPITGTRGHQP